VKIGLINDTHNGTHNNGTIMGTQCLNWLDNVLSAGDLADIDVLLVIGDIIEDYTSLEEGQQLLGAVKDEIVAYLSLSKVLFSLGNHDVQGPMTVDQIVSALGIPSNYYYKDILGVRFVMLDPDYDENTNEHEYNGGSWGGHLPPVELAWLDETLKPSRAAVVCCHHLLAPLGMSGNKYFAGGNEVHSRVDNYADVQTILQKHKDEILYCIHGHTHWDKHEAYNGIWYIQIASLVDTWSPEKKRAKVIVL